MSDTIKRLVMDGASALETRQAAAGEGMILMQESGVRKVFDGVTSPEEVMRILYVDVEEE